jgi:leucyl aminopeptidase
MDLNVTFSKKPSKTADAAILCFYSGPEPCAANESLNYTLAGFVDHALAKAKSFKGKHGQAEVFLAPEGSPYGFVVFLGLGDRAKLNAVEAEKAGGKLYAALADKNIKTVEIYADFGADNAATIYAHFAAGMALRSYRFDAYKTKKTDEDRPGGVESVNIILPVSDEAAALYGVQAKIIEGVFLARDLVNEPPNVLYPESYARRIKAELKPLGVEVEILDEKKMKKLGMGAILAVGQGSCRPPRLVIMHWRGDKKNKDRPLAFVGKGITFNTGGISIKPAQGMEEMKMDMGGSAAVVGMIKALALGKSTANVVGVVALAENMPSSKAYRPSDIVTSYSGKTIEVLNTDAEGRVVLADALSYVQDKYAPGLIIDLATLTGAMIVALGHEYCGTFSTDDELWEKLRKASDLTDEKLWRMPLDEAWKKEMESPNADIQNIAKSGRDAGSCTAAGFLWSFIDGDTPWAHLDIAGVAWIKGDRPVTPKFGTGFGVRLLERFVADNYE